MGRPPRNADEADEADSGDAIDNERTLPATTPIEIEQNRPNRPPGLNANNVYIAQVVER